MSHREELKVIRPGDLQAPRPDIEPASHQPHDEATEILEEFPEEEEAEATEVQEQPPARADTPAEQARPGPAAAEETTLKTGRLGITPWMAFLIGLLTVFAMALVVLIATNL